MESGLAFLFSWNKLKRLWNKFGPRLHYKEKMWVLTAHQLRTTAPLSVWTTAHGQVRKMLRQLLGDGSRAASCSGRGRRALCCERKQGRMWRETRRPRTKPSNTADCVASPQDGAENGSRSGLQEPLLCIVTVGGCQCVCAGTLCVDA